MFSTNTNAQMRRIVNGTEAVTYLPRLSAGGFGPGVAVANAWRRIVTGEDLAGQDLLGQTGLLWNLPVDQLGGTAPIPDGVVQDAQGNRWSVRKVDLRHLRTVYRLTCTEEN